MIDGQYLLGEGVQGAGPRSRMSHAGFCGAGTVPVPGEPRPEGSSCLRAGLGPDGKAWCLHGGCVTGGLLPPERGHTPRCSAAGEHTLAVGKNPQTGESNARRASAGVAPARVRRRCHRSLTEPAPRVDARFSCPRAGKRSKEAACAVRAVDLRILEGRSFVISVEAPSRIAVPVARVIILLRQSSAETAARP